MAFPQRSRVLRALSLVLTLACPALGAASDRSLSPGPSGLPFVRIPASSYARAYELVGEPRTVFVSAFRLMTRPVTNREFLAFVRAIDGTTSLGCSPTSATWRTGQALTSSVPTCAARNP